MREHICERAGSRPLCGIGHDVLPRSWSGLTFAAASTQARETNPTDHNDLGSTRSQIMTVIVSDIPERDAG
jgi:hypothetical protein